MYTVYIMVERSFSDKKFVHAAHLKCKFVNGILNVFRTNGMKFVL